ncbi:enoyl-[acyl-carrier-protein] reductase FabK [Clostridium sp. 'deep sea']|uniref:enoyl-[acyl-carrier-protein] reductase FabK n=1 Tax=Clostridium sp. 'deep sea' TaxID=2779445 RepID=UPI0018966D5B|nr:enoyl-[acyl-carrier-protein] reductase FabK [Clostridium sp. 'deep sea']QOR34627.1 enoyl-[acyl-carrier-protein] reductase FabK [Clostridium sp. 'deep sea']
MLNSICELLDIKYPIIQGGMAWISDANLSSAVSNAGGLGVIAAGNHNAEWLRAEIKKARNLTSKPLGVNIMLLSPHVNEVAQVVCEEKVDVVITGAGNPGTYLNMWKEAGIKVIPVIPSVALARRLEQKGVDAVICEGMEAGGHIGSLTTMALVPQIVDAVNIPVIAAGGIADSRGVLAVLALGATGVQIGTRFLVAKECNIHSNYKEKVIKSRDRDTVITGVSTGHPVRSLKNKLTREYQKLEKSGASHEELNKLGQGSLRKAAIEGDMNFGSPMAGQIAALVTKEQSVQEIIHDLIENIPSVLTKIMEVNKWAK